MSSAENVVRSAVAVEAAFVSPTPGARQYRTPRRVGLGEVDRAGHLRIDGLALYLQDVAADDSADAQLEDSFGWVLRRIVFRVHRWPQLSEGIELNTFCGGLGRSWAERRTDITVGGETVVVCAALWICIDTTGRPTQLPQSFLDIWGPNERTVSARTSHRDPPTDPSRQGWALRRADEDALRHVNNAAHCRAIVEALADRRVERAEIEFRTPLELTATNVELLSAESQGCLDTWLVSDRGVHSTSRNVLATN